MKAKMQLIVEELKAESHQQEEKIEAMQHFKADKNLMLVIGRGIPRNCAD